MEKYTGRFLLTGLFLLLTGISILAQPVKGYNLGDAVADFNLKNIDGLSVSLSNYRDKKGLIVVFTSNHCPFSKAYEERLISLDRNFAGQGYPVLAVMANDPEAYNEDSFENMKARAQTKNYPYPYVMDEAQSIARAFGATRLPEVYVLKQNAGQFILEYKGAIDDNPQDAGSVQRRYVYDAVSSLLADKPVQSPITKPIGCGIKWK